MRSEAKGFSLLWGQVGAVSTPSNKTHFPINILILMYLLTAVGLTPGGSSTVHIYTQTVHRTT